MSHDHRILELVRQRDPGVIQLAAAVSLASQVDRPLLRKARLELLPHLDAGIEADLWLGPLIQSHGPDGVVIMPGIANLLQEELARDQDLLRRAGQLTEEMHAHLPPALRLEERLTHWGLRDDVADAQIRAELAKAVKAISQPERRGLSIWAARALGRLPLRVRRMDVARELEGFVEVWNLVGRKQTAVQAGGASAKAWKDRIDWENASVALFRLWLYPGVLTIDPWLEEDEGGEPIEVPDTDPLLVQLRWKEGEEVIDMLVHLDRTKTVEVPYKGDGMDIHVADGRVYTLRRLKRTRERPVAVSVAGRSLSEAAEGGASQAAARLGSQLARQTYRLVVEDREGFSSETARAFLQHHRQLGWDARPNLLVVGSPKKGRVVQGGRSVSAYDSREATETLVQRSDVLLLFGGNDEVGQRELDLARRLRRPVLPLPWFGGLAERINPARRNRHPDELESSWFWTMRELELVAHRAHGVDDLRWLAPRVVSVLDAVFDQRTRRRLNRYNELVLDSVFDELDRRESLRGAAFDDTPAQRYVAQLMQSIVDVKNRERFGGRHAGSRSLGLKLQLTTTPWDDLWYRAIGRDFAAEKDAPRYRELSKLIPAFAGWLSHDLVALSHAARPGTGLDNVVDRLSSQVAPGSRAVTLRPLASALRMRSLENPDAITRTLVRCVQNLIDDREELGSWLSNATGRPTEHLDWLADLGEASSGRRRRVKVSRPRAELREKFSPLEQNSGTAFVGLAAAPRRFLVEEPRARELLQNRRELSAVLRPYITGAVVAQHPGMVPGQYVVDLSSYELEECIHRWPELIAEVQPDEAPAQKGWWRARTARQRRSFERGGIRDCWVCPKVSKHTIVVRQSTGAWLSDSLIVFPGEDLTRFAILQSGIHDIWLRAASPTMSSGTVRRTLRGSFLSFPWPRLGPQHRDALRELGGRFHDERERRSDDWGVGLGRVHDEISAHRGRGNAVANLRVILDEIDEVLVDAFRWPRKALGEPAMVLERLHDYRNQIAAESGSPDGMWAVARHAQETGEREVLERTLDVWLGSELASNITSFALWSEVDTWSTHTRLEEVLVDNIRIHSRGTTLVVVDVEISLGFRLVYGGQTEGGSAHSTAVPAKAQVLVSRDVVEISSLELTHPQA